MNAIVRNVLLVFAALLPIVNPFGMAPIFAEMTLGYSESIRRTVAMRVAVNCTVLLVASLFVGSYILQFFGISLAAVQMGGGLLVTIAGWRILNQQDDLKERQLDTQPSTDRILSQAFYPLTMPLTVGPGSIAVALTLGSNLHEESHLQLIVSALAAVIGILPDRRRPSSCAIASPTSWNGCSARPAPASSFVCRPSSWSASAFRSCSTGWTIFITIW